MPRVNAVRADQFFQYDGNVAELQDFFTALYAPTPVTVQDQGGAVQVTIKSGPPHTEFEMAEGDWFSQSYGLISGDDFDQNFIKMGGSV